MISIQAIKLLQEEKAVTFRKHGSSLFHGVSVSPRQDTLSVLIRTNLVVQNREAANPILSYLAYVLGGLLLAFIASVPFVTGSYPRLEASQEFSISVLLILLMIDFFNLQTKLSGPALINKPTLSLFPLSRIRSMRLRFVLMLMDKRVIFYLLPMMVCVIVLMARGTIDGSAEVALLYIFIYVIISQVFFAVYPLLRKLADRFSVRTVMQVTSFLFATVFFLPELMHLSPDLAVRIPVVSEFIEATRDITGSNVAGAMGQVGSLVLISVVLAVILTSADWLFTKIGIGGLSLFPPQQTRHAGDLRTGPTGLASKTAVDQNDDEEGDPPVLAPNAVSRQQVRRLVFLDWIIHQKEERILYTLVVYPVLAVMLARIIVRHFHKPLASLVLPVFLVTVMIGAVLTDNYFTKHGLRLKQISVFPLDRARFVLVKSLSSWAINVIVNLVAVLVLSVQFHTSTYQVFQGIIYSLFIPAVTVVLANVLILTFNIYSRHAIISFIINVAVEISATAVYVLLMLLNIILGLAFVAGFLASAYFLWIPSWGRRLNGTFQTLLEETK